MLANRFALADPSDWHGSLASSKLRPVQPALSSPPPLVLASASPRRRALMEALGFAPRIVPSGIDESSITADSPRGFALKAAVRKAESVQGVGGLSDSPAFILAADTIVVLDSRILGKPRDRDDARAMLRELSGREHTVITGLALISPTDATAAATESTGVTFRELEAERIEAWLASGGADDKAGAYGVQEVGMDFIAKIEGDLSNVIGLPLVLLGRLFGELGVPGIFGGRDLRSAVLQAYPELAALPPAFWSGLDSGGA